MQPDRPCYVSRSADQTLIDTIAEQKFAYVFGPRATGKSSLMGGAIRRLRRESQLAAVIDLTQIGARGEGADAARWYYSIAYRILRELRLKVDLQGWWQDKSSLLNEQRLVEFFWDIVLTNTTMPVTIFFDEAERAIDLPFSDELFSAFRSCYMRRVSEPDFMRLNFVILGVATPEQLCADASLSPFTEGRAVALDDFSLEESYQLAPGFGVDETQAQLVIDRIHEWTNGHPYLTQKVARAIARKGSKPDDVETVVRDLLLAPGVSREEPLLNHIRSLLTRSGPKARPALTLLSRIGDGAQVTRDAAFSPSVQLQLAGVVKADGEGGLRYRNAIFEQVFNRRWAKSAVPLGWRKPATIAAVVALAALPPLWYTQVLPQPYIDTLTVVTQDFELAEQAYEQLRRLPGFRGMAERLLSEAMVRRSERTMTTSEVFAADAVLRSLPEREELADEVLGNFWLRQSQAAMHRGERDAALLFAFAANEGKPDDARALAAELIGRDYEQLEQSFHLAVAPLVWEVDWDNDQLVVVDQTHRVRHLPLTVPASAQTPSESRVVRPVPGRLTAVQHIAVNRQLLIDADGAADAFNLLLTTQHARASDLFVELKASSGVTAEFRVPQPRADQQDLIFSARSGLVLAELAGEDIRGQWELTVVDRRAGEVGTLTSWGLQFAMQSWEDEPAQGITLPDPVRTEQVSIELAPNGRTAAAIPTRVGAAGAVSVWDLANGELSADLAVESQPEYVHLLAEPARVLIANDAVAVLWDLENQSVLTRVLTPGGLLIEPAIDPAEQFIAIAERLDATKARFEVINSLDGSRFANIESSTNIVDWALGPGASYLAILDGSRRGRVIQPTTGELLFEFIHQQELARLVPFGRTNAVIAIDVEGAIVAWSWQTEEEGSDGTYLGTTAAVDSVSIAAGGDRISFITPDGLVSVRSTAGNMTPENLGLRRSNTDQQTRLQPDGQYVVAASESMLRFWRLGASAAIPAQSLEVSSVGIDAAGTIAALGFRGGHVRTRRLAEIRSAGSGLGSVDYLGHLGAVTSMTVNSARNVLASGGDDGVVRIWDLTSVAPNDYVLRHPAGPIRALAFSRDARWLVSAAEYSARVWQAQTGELASEIPVDGTAMAVAFSPNADIVAVADSAGNIFFGAPQGSEPLRSARAPAAVTAITFSADSQILASGDRNGNLVLWDVLSAATAGTPYVFSEAVTWIRFTPDSNHLVVRSGPWVHELERLPSGLIVTATRMLPSRLGGDPVLTQSPAGLIVGVGGPTAGELLSHEFLLASPSLAPLPADSPLMGRNWAKILGMELDLITGKVGVRRQ